MKLVRPLSLGLPLALLALKYLLHDRIISSTITTTISNTSRLSVGTSASTGITT